MTPKHAFEGAATKPQPIEVNAASIPAELKAMRQWIGWDYQRRKGKWSKVPLQLVSGPAAVDDPATWNIFEAALVGHTAKGLSGIGFVFTDADPYCGIDLDDSRNPATGEIEDWAAAIVARLGSYTEVSPSGTGLKIICRAKLPGSGRKFTALGIEIYDAARYFTVTGHFHGGGAIADRQSEIETLLAELEALTAKPKPAPKQRAASAVPSVLSDAEILEKAGRASNAKRFNALWRGDISGHASASEADLALCNILAFYVGQDWERLGELVAQSGLYRHKWDRQDYRERTCRKAIADCQTFYDPEYRKPFSNAKAAAGSYRAADTVEESDGPAPRVSIRPRSSEFPLEVLPACLQRFCLEIQRSMCCPVDFPAVTILALAGAAIGNTKALEVKRGWTEGARMYLAIVAPPGSAKSPAVDAVCAPVFRRQTSTSEEWRVKREEWQQRKDIYDSAIKRKDLLPGATPTRPGSAPPEPHLYTTDATVEVLNPILQHNPRGLILIRDEVTGWVAAMNQYKGGKGSDRQFWLSAWSGGASKTDRKGTLETGSVRVSHPFINVVGGIQPDMLEILCDEQAREDGFIHRILFSYPDVPLDEYWNEHGISEPTEMAWFGILDRLYSLEMVEDERTGPRPYFVRLTPEGRVLWQRWYNEHQGELRAAEFPDNLRGPWSKFRAYCARLALAVHYIRRAAQDETGEVDDPGEELTENVNAGSVMRAAALIDYFKANTRRVYHQLRNTREDELVLRILAWLAKQPNQQCKVRDLQRAEFVKKASEGREIIKEIIDRGFAKPMWRDKGATKIAGMELRGEDSETVG